VVGARDPLIAYNVLLDSPEAIIAKRIASTIRHERDRRPELYGVRALGLFLPSQARSQVSLNLTRPDRATLPGVFHFIQQEAARYGAKLFCSEVIGLLPRRSLEGETPESLLWRDFRETQILEYWLEEAVSDES
jgi:glutamate formiminotransferase